MSWILSRKPYFFRFNFEIINSKIINFNPLSLEYWNSGCSINWRSSACFQLLICWWKYVRNGNTKFGFFLSIKTLLIKSACKTRYFTDIRAGNTAQKCTKSTEAIFSQPSSDRIQHHYSQINRQDVPLRMRFHIHFRCSSFIWIIPSFISDGIGAPFFPFS